MKKVNVYDNGELSRCIKATLIRSTGKKKLIFFEDEIEGMIEAWFIKVHRNNGGAYRHKRTNTWFYEDALLCGDYMTKLQKQKLKYLEEKGGSTVEDRTG